MPPDLVGREQEAAVVAGHLDRLSEGEGGSLLVWGAAGMGKTSLADVATAEALRRSVGVRTGRARPQARFLGHGLLLDAFGADALDLPPSVPGSVSPHANGALASLAVERLLDSITRLAAPDGLLVVLDDLHHADAASITVLAQLLPRLTSVPVLWLLTGRPPPSQPGPPEEGGAPERGADRPRTSMAGLVEIVDEVRTLGPLPNTDVLGLAELLLGGPPGPRLEAFLARAEGNPLHVTELCHALRSEGWTHTTAAAPGVVDIPPQTPLPHSFRGLLTQTVDRLPAATQRLLQLTSVLGAAAPLEQVAELAGTSTQDLLRGLQPALDADLLRHEQDTLRFRHELLRDAVYESLPLSARLTAHHQIGRRLIDVHEGADYLAWHHMIAHAQARGTPPTPGRPRAPDSATTDELLTLLSSQTPAITAAPPETVRDLLGAALTNIPTDTPTAARLALQQAWAAMMAGEIRAGETTATAVLTETEDPTVRVEALDLLAESLSLQRRYAEAVEPLSRAIDLTTDPEMRARLRVARAYSRALSGSLGDGLAELGHVHQTTAFGSTRARAASALAFGHVTQGRLTAALPLAEEAVRFDEQDGGDPRNRMASHYVLGLALLNADRWEQASEVALQGIRRCEERGLLVELPVYLSLRATLLLLQGQWADAVTEAETGLTVAATLGANRNVALLQNVIAFVAAQQGQASAAADALMQAERIVPIPLALVGPNRLATTKATLLQDPGDAYEFLRNSWTVADQLDVAVQLLELGPAYITAAATAGHTTIAASASRRVAQAAARLDTPYARGTAERCDGLAQQDIPALRRSVSYLRKCPRVLDRADTLLDLAHLASQKRQRTAARDAATEALEIYRTYGAHRSAHLATALLDDLGAPKRTSTPARVSRPSTGWDTLTRTEKAVARSSPKASPTARSRNGSTSPTAPLKPTSPTDSPSSVPAPASTSLEQP